MAATLEIHLEYSYHALTLPETWQQQEESGRYATYRLLATLLRHGVKAEWYILGHVAKHNGQLIQAILSDGHSIGSHGFWHRHGEREEDESDRLARNFLPSCMGYRSPFWDTTPRPGMAGGVFFRTLPYHWLKREIQSHQRLWLHPHDLVPAGSHWRRHLILCDPWERLERLLTEVDFHGSR